MRNKISFVVSFPLPEKLSPRRAKEAIRGLLIRGALPSDHEILLPLSDLTVVLKRNPRRLAAMRLHAASFTRRKP